MEKFCFLWVTEEISGLPGKGISRESNLREKTNPKSPLSMVDFLAPLCQNQDLFNSNISENKLGEPHLCLK